MTTTLRSLLAPLLLCALPITFAACAAPDMEDDLDDDDEGMTESALAQPGGWKPPANVVSVGDKQKVGYDDAPSWNGGKSCGGKFLAGTKELADFLKSKFSQVSSYGGYSCRQNTANSSKTSVHGTGRAIDVFIPLDGKQADNTKGDAVANWLVQNAEKIGVQYIIWDRTSWNASRKAGSKVAGYGGPHPHHDHIHVELTIEAAARKTPFFKGDQPSTEPGAEPTEPTTTTTEPTPTAPPTASGESCNSTTLGRAVPAGACVQRPSDRKWWRCEDGAWDISSATDPTCTERHPL